MFLGVQPQTSADLMDVYFEQQWGQGNPALAKPCSLLADIDTQFPDLVRWGRTVWETLGEQCPVHQALVPALQYDNTGCAKSQRRVRASIRAFRL
jgi:hypothetical protein